MTSRVRAPKFKLGDAVQFKDRVNGPPARGVVIAVHSDGVMVEWHYGPNCRMKAGYGPERKKLLEHVGEG